MWLWWKCNWFSCLHFGYDVNVCLYMCRALCAHSHSIRFCIYKIKSNVWICSGARFSFLRTQWNINRTKVRTYKGKGKWNIPDRNRPNTLVYIYISWSNHRTVLFIPQSVSICDWIQHLWSGKTILVIVDAVVAVTVTDKDDTQSTNCVRKHKHQKGHLIYLWAEHIVLIFGSFFVVAVVRLTRVHITHTPSTCLRNICARCIKLSNEQRASGHWNCMFSSGVCSSRERKNFPTGCAFNLI